MWKYFTIFEFRYTAIVFRLLPHIYIQLFYLTHTQNYVQDSQLTANMWAEFDKFLGWHYNASRMKATNAQYIDDNDVVFFLTHHVHHLQHKALENVEVSGLLLHLVEIQNVQ